MRGQVWISDLTGFEPASAISRDGRRGTWVAVDYEVGEGNGVMLIGAPGSGVPELRLRPRRR